MTLTVRHATATDMAEVRRLCWAYRDVLAERYATTPEIVEHYYAKDDYTALLDALPEKHAPPKGAIYVAELNGGIVGCGMIHEIAPNLTEIKRVYVSPEARGHGAASAIFQAAIRDATAMGQEMLVLDTMIKLVEAITLYEKLGFQPGKPFYEPDPRFISIIRFFELPLGNGDR